MAVAFGIQHDLDLECVVHFTTRDRNLMALESELLGAHALGVRNILALTGDPPRIGDYPTGTGVWDVDSIGLVEILARLNRGEDQAGSPIGQRAGVHDRLRPRPDGRRRRDRVGPARAQARRRRPPRDDPAAVRRRPGRGDARRGAAPVRPGRLPGPGAARRAAAADRRATRSSSTTRCPGITIPDAARARDARRRRARRRGRARAWPTRCSRRSTSAVAGHVRHAQLRALRAGGGARPPAPRPSRRPRGGPPDRRASRRRDSLRAASRSPRLAVLGARSRRRCRRRASAAGPPFPPPVDGPGGLRHGRASSTPRRSQQVEATIDAIEAADRRRGRGLHASSCRLRVTTDEAEAHATR